MPRGHRAANGHFSHCDEDYGREVARRAGVDLDKALKLPPLPSGWCASPDEKRELTIKAAPSRDGVEAVRGEVEVPRSTATTSD